MKFKIRLTRIAKAIKVKLVKANYIILNNDEFDSYLNKIYQQSKLEFKNGINKTETN